MDKFFSLLFHKIQIISYINLPVYFILKKLTAHEINYLLVGTAQAPSVFSLYLCLSPRHHRKLLFSSKQPDVRKSPGAGGRSLQLEVSPLLLLHNTVTVGGICSTVIFFIVNNSLKGE